MDFAAAFFKYKVVMMKKALLFLLLLTFNLTFPIFANAGFSIQGEDLLTGQKLEATARAKGLVVVFLSSRCPCSDSHLPIIEKLSQRFGDFQFVGIHSNADEAKEQAQAYFKKAHVTFPIIQDEKLKWADQFKASKTPHVFVLNSAGETLYKGGASSSAHGPSAEHAYLQDALTAIQDGKKVAVSETRTLGCAISRGDQYVW
jgi:hypothetical protein